MPKLTLPIMGGLGNQLFQIQAALSLFDGEIEILDSVGRPRRTQGIPDIWHGKLPDRVNLRAKRSSPFMEKVHSVVLRTSLDEEKHKYFRFGVNAIASLFFSIYLFRFVQVKTGSNLGFSEISKIRRNTVLIGYFQSFRWRSTQINKSYFTGSSDLLAALKLDAQQNTVCILHIRLTDYLSEPNFGTLSKKYFENALDVVCNTAHVDQIWLFSDDLANAIDVVPEKFKNRVRCIDDENLKPIEVLEMMALGHSFVISNSTFSWWAASLSNSKLVVAPNPWFVKMSDPTDLIPADWKRLNRNE